MAVEDYLMFSSAPSFRRISSYALDTDETLRLATQKLIQTPQQPAPTNIPHAYVIPIPVMPSADNVQNYNHQAEASVAEVVGSTNGSTIASNHASGGSIVAPQPAGAAGFVHYHEQPALANFQTFSYPPHGGFFLPAGYRLVYAPTGTPQSQPATPATPHHGNSRGGSPPGEPQSQQPELPQSGGSQNPQSGGSQQDQ